LINNKFRHHIITRWSSLLWCRPSSLSWINKFITSFLFTCTIHTHTHTHTHTETLSHLNVFIKFIHSYQTLTNIIILLSILIQSIKKKNLLIILSFAKKKIDLNRYMKMYFFLSCVCIYIYIYFFNFISSWLKFKLKETIKISCSIHSLTLISSLFYTIQ
jgi:hypothetical protein